MKLVSSASLLVMCTLVLVSCAEKRPLPPRGKRVGLATASESLRGALNGDNQMNVEDHCMMVVELTGGNRVVEISTGACPEDGSLANPVVTLKLWSGWTKSGDRQSTLLLAGDSTVSSENTPVGVVSDISTGEEGAELKLELEQLCQGNGFMRMDLSENCSIKVSDDGHLMALEYDARKTLESHLLARADKTDTHLEGVDSEITQVKESVAVLARGLILVAEELDAFEEEVAQTFVATITALTQHVEKVALALNTKIDLVDKKVDAVQAKLTQAVEDLGVQLRKEEEKAREALEKKLRGEGEEARKALEEKIQASEEKIAQSIKTIEEQLQVAKDGIADLKKAGEKSASKEDLESARKEAQAANKVIEGAIQEARIANLEATIEIRKIQLETAQASNDGETIAYLNHLIEEAQAEIAKISGSNE